MPKPRTPRATVHRYPLAGDTKSYLLDHAPRWILEAARRRAQGEQRSLRVVIIDLLEQYIAGRAGTTGG